MIVFKVQFTYEQIIPALFFFCTTTTTTAVGDVEEIEIIHLRAVL